MCGRYTLTDPRNAIESLFPDLGEAAALLEARFNVAPTQGVPVVRTVAGRMELAILRWGLVPAWASRDRRLPTLINARCETVNEKPSFRSAFRSRRCLVFADGFYEWERVGEKKLPWRFTVGGGHPFVMAGVWERWTGGDEPMESVAILTTASNQLVGRIHDRMPVILGPRGRAAWLTESPEPLPVDSIFRPYPAASMESCRVSVRVNKVGSEDPGLVDPVDPVE